MQPFFHRPYLVAMLALGWGIALPALAQDVYRVEPDKLPSHWILLNTKVDAEVPNSGKNLDKPSCVAVAYTIGADGVTRDIQVRKAMPSSDLGPVAVSAVAHFRYGPALSNRNADPVATYYVVLFNAPDDKAQKQNLLDACKLPGYDQD